MQIRNAVNTPGAFARVGVLLRYFAGKLFRGDEKQMVFSCVRAFGSNCRWLLSN